MREEFQNKEKGQKMAPVWDLSKWQKSTYCFEMGEIAKQNRFGRQDQKFSFGHVGLEMSTRHAKGDGRENDM